MVWSQLNTGRDTGKRRQCAHFVEQNRAEHHHRGLGDPGLGDVAK
jgi:hypothetical protein